jgi:hypothetical protein
MRGRKSAKWLLSRTATSRTRNTASAIRTLSPRWDISLRVVPRLCCVSGAEIAQEPSLLEAVEKLIYYLINNVLL